jgi:hypothetical protein
MPAVCQRETALVCLSASGERIPRHVIVLTIPRRIARARLLCADGTTRAKIRW